MTQSIKLTTALLESIVALAETNQDGATANYIPELAHVDPSITAIAVHPLHQKPLMHSNQILQPVTLQSTAKLVPLIGLLEEQGAKKLFEWVKVEPSGDEFSSITRLEQFGPKPSNPMLNAGAITLCSHIPGTTSDALNWLDSWINILFNQPLSVNHMVYNSEKNTGDRNRSLAYLLHSRGNLNKNVNDSLELYFTLCSYEASLAQMLYLPTLLANGGRCPHTQNTIISPETCKITLAIMATCGLYDETGTHMVRTGIPAKSGVSGYTVAALPGKAGIVVLSPRVNHKGNSIRGEIMLEHLSQAMNWHFAMP